MDAEKRLGVLRSAPSHQQVWSLGICNTYLYYRYITFMRIDRLVGLGEAHTARFYPEQWFTGQRGIGDAGTEPRQETRKAVECACEGRRDGEAE